MSKKMMKRSLALGALMAFVITGSAMAAELSDVNAERLDTSSETGTLIGVNASSYNEAVKFSGNSLSITVANKKDNNATYGFYDILDKYENIIGISKNDTNQISFSASGSGEVRTIQAGQFGRGSLKIYSNNVIIKAHSDENIARAVNVKSGYDLLIDAAKTTISATSGENGLGIGIGAFSASTVDIKGDLELKADYAIAVSSSDVKINDNGNSTVQIEGLVAFHKSGSNAIDSNVLLNLTGENSYLNGNIIAEDDRYDDPATVVSGMKLILSRGAKWTTIADGNGLNNFVNSLTINDGVINVSDGTKIAIGYNDGDKGWDGSGAIILENAAKDSQVVLKGKSDTSEIIVKSNIENIDNMSDEEISKALSEMQGAVVMSSDGSEAADYFANSGDSSLYDEVKIVSNATSVDALQKVVSVANYSVSDMAALSLMSWRAENNDMHKRLGELRDANGEHGVWARMTRGENEYKSVNNQYNSYQLGYDQKSGDWTVGAAVSYTEGETRFAKGNGENDHTGLAVYGSKLNKDGSYIDMIAKYAKLDHKYTAHGGIGSGEYDTDGFALSAEYGKRFEQGNGLWIEPQIELTYGLVDSVDFNAANGNVSLDDMNSLVGRVGLRTGKDIKDGDVYVRASYLYDFEGETDITFNDMETIKQDLGGGWWEVGVGANINLSKATYIYADVEKTFGGEVDTNWQWNLGVRYSF